jgi:hypothetical protein
MLIWKRSVGVWGDSSLSALSEFEGKLRRYVDRDTAIAERVAPDGE